MKKIIAFLKWWWHHPVMLHLLMMLVVLIAVFCTVVWWLGRYTNHGESIAVPDLYNKDLAEAQAATEALGLHLEVTDSLWVDSVRPGRVLHGQQPAAGTSVKAGRTILVRLRKVHRDRKPIPDLINNSGYRHARAELEFLGFNVGEPIYREGWKDYVLGIRLGSRELRTGDLVTEGSTLTLVVGDGSDDEAQDSEEDSIFIPANDDDFDPIAPSELLPSDDE